MAGGLKEGFGGGGSSGPERCGNSEDVMGGQFDLADPTEGVGVGDDRFAPREAAKRALAIFGLSIEDVEDIVAANEQLSAENRLLTEILRANGLYAPLLRNNDTDSEPPQLKSPKHKPVNVIGWVLEDVRQRVAEYESDILELKSWPEVLATSGVKEYLAFCGAEIKRLSHVVERKQHSEQS